MLEFPALMIRPWLRSDHLKTRWSRAIVNPTSGVQVGIVRLDESRLPAWLGWLAQPVMTVSETDDESLLFTLHRCGLRGQDWRVWDAEGKPVGTVTRQQLRPGAGPGVIWIQSEGVTEERLIASNGRELCRLRFLPEGTCLEFSSEETDPFVRMMLLAAGLRRLPPNG